MFAYVKYLPPDNNCAVVATSQIRKFKLDKFDKFKHYKIISGDVTKKALILAIKDSKEELDSIVSSGKRHPIPPGYLQKSCTEESDIESTLQKVITTDANKVKSVLEKKIAVKQQQLLEMELGSSESMEKENNQNKENLNQRQNKIMPKDNQEFSDGILANDNKEQKQTAVKQSEDMGEEIDNVLSVPGEDSMINEEQNDHDIVIDDDTLQSTVLEPKSSHVKRRKKQKKTNMKKLKKSKLNSNEDSSTKVKEVQDGLALMSGPINNKDDVQPSTELSHLSKNDASTLASSKSKYKYKKSKDNKKRANDEVSTKLTCQITSMERTISDLVQSFNSFRELAMEKLVANEENWRQLKTANETSKVSKAPIDVNDIRRPPPVGYVRVDNDMIHLGRGIWLPQATFNNDIYTAGSSLAMVVKNIAVSVFGVEYLKSHSVKGKGSNKTKSIPRPAIDPTKALAIRDIFEYYLKTERKMTGQALMNEVDLYEEYIRQKISDLLRPPRQANKNNKKSEASQKNVTHDKNDVPAAASGDMNPELNTTNPTNNTHDNQLTSSEKSSVGDSSSSEGSSGSSNEESKSASDDSIE